MLRHFLAALAYRTQKALRGAPPTFGEFHAGHDVRTPAELVLHMTSVLGYARTYFVGGRYRPEPLPTLAAEESSGSMGCSPIWRRTWSRARRFAISVPSSCSRDLSQSAMRTMMPGTHHALRLVGSRGMPIPENSWSRTSLPTGSARSAHARESRSRVAGTPAGLGSTHSVNQPWQDGVVVLPSPPGSSGPSSERMTAE